MMTIIRSRISPKLVRGFFLLPLYVSSQLLSVTKNDVKIWPILINSEFILFIMNLLNSWYAYSNLNLEFCYTSL